MTDEATNGHDRSYVKRRLIVNTGASIAANLWAIIVSILVVPVLIGGLGLEAFGIWALLLAFSALTGWFSLADFGVGVASTRALAIADAEGDVHGLERVLSTTVWYFIVIGLASTAVYAIGGWVVLDITSFEPADARTNLQLAVLLAAVQVGIDLASRSFISILDGLQRVDLARLADGIRRTLVAGFAAVAAATLGTLQAAVCGALAGSVIGAIVAAAIGLRTAACRIRIPSKSVAVSLIRSGLSIGLLRPLGVIQRTMDRLIVGAFIGPSAVAGVEIAASLQGGVDAILSASSNSVTPSAAYLQARHDPAGIRRLLTRGTRYSLLSSAPAAVFVILLSAPMIEIWIGDDAPPESATLASLAGLATLVMAIAAVGSNLLVGIGRASTVLVAAGISILVNLSLSIWLVQSLGPEGVFIATLISALVVTPALVVPSLRLTSATLREFTYSALVPGLAPSVVLALVIVGIRLTLVDAADQVLAAIFIGGGAVAASTLWLGLERSERTRLGAYTRRSIARRR